MGKIVPIYKNNKENKEKLEQQKTTKEKDIQQKVKKILWESQMNWHKHGERRVVLVYNTQSKDS